MYLLSSFRHNWRRLLKHSSDISTILTIVNLFTVVTKKLFWHHLYSAVVLLSLSAYLFRYCWRDVKLCAFMLVSCRYSVKMPNLRFWFGGCYPPFRHGAGREKENWVRAPITLTFSPEGACFSPVTVDVLQTWASKSGWLSETVFLFCTCVVSTMMPAYYFLFLWKNKLVIVAHAAQDPGKLRGVIGVVGDNRCCAKAESHLALFTGAVGLQHTSLLVWDLAVLKSHRKTRWVQP